MTDKTEPRALQGAMELLPTDQILFNRMYDTIRSVYEQFGFLPLDTPVIEYSAVLLAKAGEYAADGDRLHNFKRAAHLQGITPVGALSGMMCKHTVSIYDLINGYEEGRAIEPELWDEKIIDNINYLILLRAVLREERE